MKTERHCDEKVASKSFERVQDITNQYTSHLLASGLHSGKVLTNVSIVIGGTENLTPFFDGAPFVSSVSSTKSLQGSLLSHTSHSLLPKKDLTCVMDYILLFNCVFVLLHGMCVSLPKFCREPRKSSKCRHHCAGSMPDSRAAVICQNWRSASANCPNSGFLIDSIDSST